jgi:hypothetical protein
MLLTTALLVACSLCQLGLGAPVQSAPPALSTGSTIALTTPVPCRDGKSPESKLIVEYRTLEDLFAAAAHLDDNDGDDDWLMTGDSCFVPAETVLKAIPAPALAEISKHIDRRGNVIGRRGYIGMFQIGKEIWETVTGEAKKKLASAKPKIKGDALKKKLKRVPELPKTLAEWSEWVKKNGIGRDQARDARDFEERKAREALRGPSFSPEEICDGLVGFLVGNYGYDIANAMIAGGSFARKYGLDTNWSGFKELYKGFQVKETFTMMVTRDPRAVMDLPHFRAEIKRFREACPKGTKSISI